MVNILPLFYKYELLIAVTIGMLNGKRSEVRRENVCMLILMVNIFAWKL